MVGPVFVDKFIEIEGLAKQNGFITPAYLAVCATCYALSRGIGQDHKGARLVRNKEAPAREHTKFMFPKRLTIDF